MRFRIAFSCILLSLGTSVGIAQQASNAPSTFTTSPVREVKIAAQEAGIVTKLHIQEGSQVKKLQTLVDLNKQLFQLDAERTKAEYELAVIEAKNKVDLQFAQQSRKNSQINVDRLFNARKKVELSVSNTEFEQSKLELLKAELSEKQAARQMRIAKKRRLAKENEKDIAAKKLELRSIRSTLDGMVVDVLVDEGEWVQAGEPIARIINYDKLKVKGYLPANSVSVEDVGKKIYFAAAKPTLPNNPRFVATIKFVSPEIKREFFKEAHVRVVAEIDNKDHKLRTNTVMQLVQPGK